MRFKELCVYNVLCVHHASAICIVKGRAGTTRLPRKWVGWVHDPSSARERERAREAEGAREREYARETERESV